MKFKSGTRRRALEYENDIVVQWKKNKTFEKSVEMRPKDNSYVFYDGPPFISGVPHHGTLLSSIVKDAVPRYQTMKGKRVERVWGWDCHGLPAERFTEKKLGIHSREEVLEYGIEKYILACRANMVQTSSEWEDVVDRIGRWVDFKGAYKTMDKEYMESVWWAFKELYEKGKIYEGEKVLMYCTLDATPLSKAEVTMDAGAYQDVTDPSVYVKFKLQNMTNNSDTIVEKIDLNESTHEKFAEATRLGPDYADKIKSMSAEDKAVLFAAKVNGEYVGRVTLWLDDWKDDSENSGQDKIVTDFYPNLPAINALEVREEFRRKGIATELLKAAEDEARLRGFTEIGLGVEADNNPAINLYEKTGYKKKNLDGQDSYHIWWQERDRHNNVQKFEMDCFLMIKDLTLNISGNTYLLAWTTTPWTLPANTAVAVNKDFDYVEVEIGGERLIIAKGLLNNVLTDEKHNALDYKVIRELKGKELVGQSYEPLLGVDRGENAHKIWHAPYVSLESGTGIVHLAPAYGEEDFELAHEEKVPVVHVIDENGNYTESDWKGQNVWEANKPIAKELKKRGIVWKIDYIQHSYPHCHRCGTRLMYRAHPSWFMDIEAQREDMLKENGNVNWFPAHIKQGRFAKNIEQAPDWNISRDRFWATAMPVWKGTDAEGKEHVKVIGSYEELKELSGQELDDYHRPWVDDITFEIDGVTYTRIDKVMDSWFEAGSMPFAQFHYPFENKQKFEDNFPGDFIVEYISQVRAWFYYMHSMSVALFGEYSFKNVIVTGTLAGSDGRKMSKQYGNYTDPNELMNEFSADSLRFVLLSSPVLNGEDFSLKDKDVGDVARKLSMVWNMYDFFTMYAEVDGWEYSGNLSDPHDDCTNPLDQWVISRVHQLNRDIERHMDAYDIPNAVKPILPFIEDASNWYVRRSRRRFWKSGDDADKNNAYRTLHYVLVQLAQIIAPFTPFLAEELYQKLTGGESVHLLDWPVAGHVNKLVVQDMETVREYVNQGLSLRAKERMKVRQPLTSVTVPTLGKFVNFEDILTEELNVKKVIQGKELVLDFRLTDELKGEGLMREVVRHVQAARKDAGLNVDDRIHLHLNTNDTQLTAVVNEHEETIANETLATFTTDDYSYNNTVKVEGTTMTISLEKA